MPNHGLILKKVSRLIKFNQRAWLKSCIDMNTKKRMEAENQFDKHRDIKLMTTDEKRNRLVSEPNYHTIKRFS